MSISGFDRILFAELHNAGTNLARTPYLEPMSVSAVRKPNLRSRRVVRHSG